MRSKNLDVRVCMKTETPKFWMRQTNPTSIKRCFIVSTKNIDA